MNCFLLRARTSASLFTPFAIRAFGRSSNSLKASLEGIPSPRIKAITSLVWQDVSVSSLSSHRSFPTNSLKREQIKPQQACISYALIVLGIIVGGCFIATYLEGEDPEVAPQLDPPANAPQEVKDIWDFVKKFNQSSHEERQKLLLKAQELLRNLKYKGGLGQCYNPDSEVVLTRNCLVEFLYCKDIRIQNEAIYLLAALLSQKDVSESSDDLLKLEKHVGQALRSMTGKSSAIIEETMNVYRLIIERLYIYHAAGGDELPIQEALKMLDQIAKIGNNLGKSPSFQYQVSYTRDLVERINRASRPFTDSILAISQFTKESGRPLLNQYNFFKDKGTQIFAYAAKQFSADPAVAKELSSVEALDKLISPEGIEEIERSAKEASQILRSFQKMILTLKLASFSPVEKYEKIMMWKALWGCLPVTHETIQTLMEMVSPKGKQVEWQFVYAIVEMLTEVAQSHPELVLKIEALTQLIHLIRPETPWQVRYKIKEAFLLLRSNDALYTLLIEAQEKDKATPCIPADISFDYRKGIHKMKQRFLQDMQPEHPTPIIGSWKKPDKYQIHRVEEWDQMVRCFKEANIKLQTCFQVVTGQKGVGKTELALQYAYQFRNDYAGVCFLQASALEEGLTALAKHLKIEDPDPEKLKQKLKERLETEDAQKRGWLFVVDDANQPSFSDQLIILNSYLPNKGVHAHVLITSDNPRPSWQGLTDSVLPLEPFSPLQSTSFFLQFLKRGQALQPDHFSPLPPRDLKKEKAVAQLAEAMGHLPIGLSLAAAYYRSVPALSVTTYLSQFRTEKQRWATLNTIVSSWMAASAVTIREISANPDHAVMLVLCCHLGPRNIPTFFLRQCLQFHHKKTLDNADEVSWNLNEVLKSFAQYSWTPPKGDDDLISINPLLQETGRLYFRTPSKDAPASSLKPDLILEEALSVMEQTFIPTERESEQLYPHLLALLQQTEHLENCRAQRTVLYIKVLSYLATFVSLSKAQEVMKTAQNIDRENAGWSEMNKNIQAQHS